MTMEQKSQIDLGELVTQSELQDAVRKLREDRDELQRQISELQQRVAALWRILESRQ